MSVQNKKKGNAETLLENRARGVGYSREQRQEHREAAEQLLAQSIGTTAVVERALRRQFGCGPRHAARVVEEVLDEWKRMADPRQVEKNRAQAITRLRKDLHRARYKRVTREDGTSGFAERADPPWSAIAQLERTLSALEGTNQPIRIEVDLEMNQAAVGSIARMTASEVRELLSQGAETERLAQLARARLPEFVDAEFEPAVEPIGETG